MKTRKLKKKTNRTNSTRHIKRTEKNLSLGYQSLEPRKMLAGDFGVYTDSVITDWSGDTFAGNAWTDRGQDVTVQPDGKYLVSGVVSKDQYQEHQDLMLARYNADFSKDLSFGNNGLAFADFGPQSRDYGYTIALESDGDILVVGTGFDYGGGTIAPVGIAARFSSAGTLDATFVTPNFIDGGYQGIVQQANGGYVLMGSDRPTGDWDVLLTRLNSDFSIDTNFGTSGTIIHDFNNGNNKGHAILQRSDGKMVVVGNSQGVGYFVAFNADGSTTGIEGMIDTSVPGRNQFRAAVIDVDDNIYLVGWSDTDNVTETTAVKLNSDFTQDMSYGDNGVFRFNASSGGDSVNGAELDSQGRLAVSGGTGESAYVFRVTPSGELDLSFADNGIANIGAAGFTSNGMGLDNSDRVIVAGEFVNGTVDTILVRVNPNVEFADSFENGQWNGLWVEDSQNDWFTSTQRAIEGSYSAEVDGYASNATLTVMESIDMSAYATAELSFSWYIESRFDSGEYLALDVSNDGFQSYSTLAQLDGNQDQENTWHDEQLELDPQFLDSEFQFRFRSKVSSSSEDANVDNVILIGTSFSGPPNQAPTITSISNNSAIEDQLYSYDVEAIDPDVGDVLTFSLTTAPAGMAIDSSSGLIQWTPNNDHVGSNAVNVRVQDSAGALGTQMFAVNVANVNDAPTITSSPATSAMAESLYTYDIDAVDPDVGDTLTFTLTASPTGMTIDGLTGLIQWTPSVAQAGVQVSVRVQDADGLNATQDYSINVAAVNHAPTITSSPVVTATEDVTYSYNVVAQDPDAGDVLTFLLDTAPSGMTIDGSSGQVLWTPTNDDVGVNYVTIRVIDQVGAFDTQTFELMVANTNDAPVIGSTPSTTAIEDQLYSYDVDATDVDTSDTLSYSIDSYPAGMTINGSTGLIQWTPTAAQLGDHAVAVRVDDGAGGSDTQYITITVEEASFAPTVVFSDNFENGDLPDQWSQDSQNDWRRRTSKRFDGSYAAEVDGYANNATLTSDSRDMSGYGGADLTFAWLIEKGFDTNEFMALDFKDDSGTWTEVRILRGNVDQENAWHQETVRLEDMEDHNYFHNDFQFRFRSTVSSSREDAYVDTVELMATSAAFHGAEFNANSQAESLAMVDLRQLATWANQTWATGLGLQHSNYELRTADLPGNLLGRTNGNTITIDFNGAEMGWYVDDTPWNSSKFQSENEGIGKRYDLLSVLAHELGHLQGQDHDDGGAMDSVLNVGQRSDINLLSRWLGGTGDSVDASRDKHDVLDQSFADWDDFKSLGI